MMTITEHNLIASLKQISWTQPSEMDNKPLVGVDECFNRQEILNLTSNLVSRGLISCRIPLWFESRERDGKLTGTFSGGVDQDSALRQPNELIADIGIPVKHQSWSDLRVVQFLIAHFPRHSTVVLLTENIRQNQGGVRRLLKDIVKPEIEKRPYFLSLTGLFKKGKTRVDDYCREVLNFCENANYQRGYSEILF